MPGCGYSGWLAGLGCGWFWLVLAGSKKGDREVGDNVGTQKDPRRYALGAHETIGRNNRAPLETPRVVRAMVNLGRRVNA